MKLYDFDITYNTRLNEGFNDLDFDSNSINYLVSHNLYNVSRSFYNAIICFKFLLAFLYLLSNLITN